MLTSQIDVSLNQYVEWDRRGNQNIDVTCLSRRPTGDGILNGIHQFRLSLIILILRIARGGRLSAALFFMGNAAPVSGAKGDQTGCARLCFFAVSGCCLVIKIFDHSLIFPCSVAVELTRD